MTNYTYGDIREEFINSDECAELMLEYYNDELIVKDNFDKWMDMYIETDDFDSNLRDWIDMYYTEQYDNETGFTDYQRAY